MWRSGGEEESFFLPNKPRGGGGIGLSEVWTAGGIKTFLGLGERKGYKLPPPLFYRPAFLQLESKKRKEVKKVGGEKE